MVVFKRYFCFCSCLHRIKLVGKIYCIALSWEEEASWTLNIWQTRMVSCHSLPLDKFGSFLGKGCLGKVEREPRQVDRPNREVSMATPWEGTTPACSYQLAWSQWKGLSRTYPFTILFITLHEDGVNEWKLESAKIHVIQVGKMIPKVQPKATRQATSPSDLLTDYICKLKKKVAGCIGVSLTLPTLDLGSCFLGCSAQNWMTGSSSLQI